MLRLKLSDGAVVEFQEAYRIDLASSSFHRRPITVAVPMPTHVEVKQLHLNGLLQLPQDDYTTIDELVALKFELLPGDVVSVSDRLPEGCKVIYRHVGDSERKPLTV